MPDLNKISGISEIIHLFISSLIYSCKQSYIFNDTQILTTYNISGTVISVEDITLKDKGSLAFWKLQYYQKYLNFLEIVDYRKGELKDISTKQKREREREENKTQQ